LNPDHRFTPFRENEMEKNRLSYITVFFWEFLRGQEVIERGQEVIERGQEEPIKKSLTKFF